jgi:histidyl-tRNA synthetase
MQDVLPESRAIYRYAEDAVRSVLESYGYSEIGLPVIESTILFERLVGEATDIVEKEMYTFTDRSGDSITLRPEGTAGCVRAAQENGLVFNQIQRLWYAGSMFRYERPQKGRFRQFEQIGAECFGMPGPDIDAEILFLTARIWQQLGLTDKLTLELNSLGSLASRAAYKDTLVEYLSARRDELDEDSRRRLVTNPLRILDSKDAGTKAILAEAPLLIDFLDDDSKRDFDGLRELLEKAQVPFVVNPLIVRGLDYYNKTVFEWTTTSLGAQGTVCGGGRYDTLVEELGGRPTPAVGFAIGLDRVALLLEGREISSAGNVDLFVASLGTEARTESLLLAEHLRRTFADLRINAYCGEGKLKGQLKKADASGALLALILGEDEVAAGEVTVKPLRTRDPQKRMSWVELERYVREFFV